MIKLGDYLFTDLDRLNEALVDKAVTVTFSFWQGRRFSLDNDSTKLRLNDIIDAVRNSNEFRSKPERSATILKTIKQMEKLKM